ncbi:MAG TPA: hypothetical protein VEI02_14245 [Planctomycetota bacterium]|nr:hypothetical protein [Planctomycetota bacterium]
MSLRATCAACALAAALFGQAEDPDAGLRPVLFAQATDGKKADVLRALTGRDGEVFDLVVGAIGEDVAKLEASRALLPFLPEPERVGLGLYADRWSRASAEARRYFAEAYAALRAFEAKAEKPGWSAEERSAEASIVRQRLAAAPDAYLAARIDAAEAGFDPDASFHPHRERLRKAAEAFETAGDRRRRALALLFWSKALAEADEGGKALEARNAAQNLAIDAGVSLDKGPAGRLFGGVDLASAEEFLEDGRFDAALTAAGRARQLLKTYDPDRDLRIHLVVADAKQESSGVAAALDAVKSIVGQIPRVNDPRRLVDGARIGGRVLRRSGKLEDALRFLEACRRRAKQVPVSKADEAALSYYLALCHAALEQWEPAMVQCVTAVDLAKAGGAPYVARIAHGNRALLQLSQNREAEARKTLGEALAISAGGPTLDRLSAAVLKLAFGETLLGGQKIKEAFDWMSEAMSAADDLGVELDRLPGRLDTVRPEPPTPLRERLFAAIRLYNVGRDYSDFAPVYLAAERRRFEDLLRYLPDDDGVGASLGRAVRDSEVRLARLRRGLVVGQRTPSEADAARLLETRKALRADALAASPLFAARNFPQPSSFRKARENVCGARGVVWGAHVQEKGGFVFAFTYTDQFQLHVVPEAVPFKKLCEEFAAAAADPKTPVAEYVRASGALWRHMVEPLLQVFDGKDRIAIYMDPATDDLPLEALVPPDAPAKSYETLPYLARRHAVGRLVTASLATAPRNDAARKSWLRKQVIGGLGGAKLDDLFETARVLDGDIGPRLTRTDAVSLWTVASRARGGPPPDFAAQGLFLVGPGAAQKYVEWPAGKAPDAALLFDPLKADREGMDPVRTLFGRGLRALYAPRAAMDAGLASAMYAKIARSMIADRAGPLEALRDAQLALLDGKLEVGAKSAKIDGRHPASWTAIRCWTVNP